jgi:hypothetical protein
LVPHRALIREDFPALDRPARAICGRPSFGKPGKSAAVATSSAERSFIKEKGKRKKEKVETRTKEKKMGTTMELENPKASVV